MQVYQDREHQGCHAAALFVGWGATEQQLTAHKNSQVGLVGGLHQAACRLYSTESLTAHVQRTLGCFRGQL